MFFEVENTPEHIRRQRNAKINKDIPVEEPPPLLTLAAFSKPPIVVFENIAVGSTADRTLEVCNPSSKRIELSLAKPLPSGVSLVVPGDVLMIEPQTKCLLTFAWSPVKPVVSRESVTFAGCQRSRFDVVLVLKAVPMKPLKQKPASKRTPKKIGSLTVARKVKTSPNALIKRQVQAQIKNRNTFYLPMATHSPIAKPSSSMNAQRNDAIYKFNHNSDNKENESPDESVMLSKCPFKSLASLPDTSCSFHCDNTDFSIDPRALNRAALSDKNQQYFDVLQERYPPTPIKKPESGFDVFDSIKFTPTSTSNIMTKRKYGKQDTSPRLNDSLDDVKFNMDVKHNINSMKNPFATGVTDNTRYFTEFNQNPFEKTHDIIDLSMDIDKNPFDVKADETRDVIDLTRNAMNEAACFLKPQKFNESFPVCGKKASSPIRFNGIELSFSLNHTEISTDLSFHPNRNSTERKILANNLTFNNATNDYPEHANEQTFNQPSSETFTKPDSPIVPLNPETSKNIQSSPYNGDSNKLFTKEVHRRILNWNDPQANKRNYRDRNSDTGIRSVIEAGLWQKEKTPPPRSFNRPLLTVPEESSNVNETNFLDKTDKRQLTFVINQTFDKKEKLSLPAKTSWTKKSVKSDIDVWKVPLAKTCDIQNLPIDINRESFLVTNNVYAQTSTVDPFLSETYFYDEKSVDKLEKEFRAWLNYILTPPADLDTNNAEVQHFDIGKAWIDNRNKELPAAPTKEQVSSKYHDSHRLGSLRKAAKNLLNSTEIKTVYQKLSMHIDKKNLSIRPDRNIHLNIGLQKVIVNILLCYNPLWLRIALEAIYNTVIPLSSNSDICGLSSFIVQRMFKDPYLRNKHANPNVQNVLLPSYADQMNKFTLKKFFLLVYFLDQAKQKKLIFHDPCLFSRNAQCKESRDIVITFTRELIAGVGDISKHLRLLGYVLSHKQSYLDEFKFGVQNIAVDLKDGVRLTKVMEVILCKPGLTASLRTPAISRLQKIHNVQLALNALRNANFNIVGDITAKDIVDGHREKTLSLLWQIIHVFRAPLFEKAAIEIQRWWKNKYLKLTIEKRIKEREELNKHNAACTIQRRWRSILYERMVQNKLQEITKATVVLQALFRMLIRRRLYLKQKQSAIKIQTYYRSYSLMKQQRQKYIEVRSQIITIQKNYKRFISRKRFIQIKNAAILIQTKWRAYWTGKLARQEYLNKQKAAISIQRYFRSYCRMKKERNNYIDTRNKVILIQKIIRRCIAVKRYKNIRNATLLIQSRWRAYVAGKLARGKYLKQKMAAIRIQNYYRACKLMKNQRQQYIDTRNKIVVVQKNFRRFIAKKRYNDIKRVVLLIQSRWREKLATWKARNEFLILRNATIKIQRFFRAYVLMKTQKKQYIQLRTKAILLQKCVRGLIQLKKYRQLKKVTTDIQRIFRARQQLKHLKKEFDSKNKAAVLIQKNFKRYIAHKKYVQISNAVSLIQTRWREYLAAKQTRSQYIKLKECTIHIQRYYRAFVLMKNQRTEFMNIKSKTILLQKVIRGFIQTRKYRQLKKTTIDIQRIFRAKKQLEHLKMEFKMRNEAATLIQRNVKRCIAVKKYSKVRSSVFAIQKRWRETLEARKTRKEFIQLKNAANIVHKYFRAQVLMRNQRKQYIELKMKVILLQKIVRGYIQCKKYRLLKKKTIDIQRLYRAKKELKCLKIENESRTKAATVIQKNFRRFIAVKKYKKITTAVLYIQKRWRETLLAKQTLHEYIKLKRRTIRIQRFYKVCLLMKNQRNEYLDTRNKIILLQKSIRGFIQAKKYRQLKAKTIDIQRIFRAKKQLQLLKKEFETRNRAATIIQKNYKRYTAVKQYIRISNAVSLIQKRWRETLASRKARKEYLNLRESTLKIQRLYRSYLLMKKQRKEFNEVRAKVVLLQKVFRGYIQAKKYKQIRKTIIAMQKIYRAIKKLRKLKKEHARRKRAAIVIQKNFKRYIAVKKYVQISNAVLLIQTKWRLVLEGKQRRGEFLTLRSNVIKIQALARGYILRKKVVLMRKELEKRKLQAKLEKAVSKIQALWRGFVVRRDSCSRAKRVCEALEKHARNSDAPKLAERNEEAIYVLTHLSDMASIIRAFDTLCLLTEVYPMIYEPNAQMIAQRLTIYMSVSNRSVSSLVVLSSGVTALTNLARYSATGVLIYNRECMAMFLKLFLRWCDKDSALFCSMCTYLFLHSKYSDVYRDLTDYFTTSENVKLMQKVKQQILRRRRMEENTTKSKNCKGLDTNIKWSANGSNTSLADKSHVLPDLEPHFGLKKSANKYFNDDVFAIKTLFKKFFISS